MLSISSLFFCSPSSLNAACQDTPSLHSPLISRRLQGLSDDRGVHISGPFLFLGLKTNTQRSLGQFLPDILQMLTIQRVQIRPSSPVDMCCLQEERYQQVCSVQESLSLVPPLPVLTLSCSCCVLGSSSPFSVELCLWRKSSVFIRRLKMRYHLREIKSWGIAQTLRAPVFSAVATNQ